MASSQRQRAGKTAKHLSNGEVLPKLNAELYGIIIKPDVIRVQVGGNFHSVLYLSKNRNYLKNPNQNKQTKKKKGTQTKTLL